MRLRSRASRAAFVALAVLASASCSGREAAGPTPLEPPSRTVDVRVSVAPKVDTLTVGDTTRLTATVQPAANSHVPTWTSTDPSIVTVDRTGLATALAPGSAHVRASHAGRADSVLVVVRPELVTSLTPSPSSVTLTVGDSAALAATPYSGRGTALQDRVVTWSIADSNVALVSPDGLVRAIGVGVTVASALCEGTSVTVPITVALAAVASVHVSAPAATVARGATLQLTATPRDAAGRPLGDRQVAWQSSDVHVATVSTGGLVSALATGTVTITATADGVAGAIELTSTTPAVATVTVTLNSAALTVGEATQAVAVARDADGAAIDGLPVSWAVSSGTNIAAISPSGLVNAIAAGSATVEATIGGVRGSAPLTVTPPAPEPVVRIRITAANDSLAIGGMMPLSATLEAADGSTLIGRAVVWKSSAPSVLSVTGNEQTATAVAVAEGSATVSATSEGVTATVALTVYDDGTVVLVPGDDIQAKVNASAPGTRFVLRAGTYSRQSIVPKSGMSFVGDPGAVLDGGNVTPHAFLPGPAPYPSNVSIRNLVIQHYAPPIQLGAILAGGHSSGEGTTGWVVADCEVRDNTTMGIRIGHRMQVLRTKVLRNGQIGIGGIGDGTLIEGNEIAYNNAGSAYDADFEAGGTKFVLSDGLVMRNNFVHHNGGPGLWSDIDNINTLYEGNRVEDNAREGIVHEISYAAVIRNNVVQRNGLTDSKNRDWLWNAGIGIHASPDVEVYGNTVVGNRSGIVAVQQARGSGRFGPHLVERLDVHDNVITQSGAGRSGDANAAAGVVQDVSDDAIFTARGNVFRNNTYVLGANVQPFAWMNGNRTIAEWQAYGLDVAGVFR